MDHILDINSERKESLHNIFKKISSGNTILFLGAGISVTNNKKFLSKDIIDLYQDKIRKQFNTNDIVEFLDQLIATKDFDRNDFDNFVDRILRSIDVNEAHKILASIKWREIITTNMDLTIEKAYYLIKDTVDEQFDLIPIRSLSEYFNRLSIDKVGYVKINGCISDKSKYPLIFSSDDFKRSKQYYKNVLQNLKNMSSDINFLSVGYSYSDPFAKMLLKRFDEYNYRERRWMYNLDPFILNDQLDYFTQQRICIVKTDYQTFFNEYKKWEFENHEAIVNKKHINFYNPYDKFVNLSNKLKVRLENSIVQLNKKYKYHNITNKEFYLGEEPSFDIILKNFDVVREEKLELFKQRITSIINYNESNIIPVIFIKGFFGIGKSTFSYRLISELLKDGQSLAFEVVDHINVNATDLIELIDTSKAKNIYVLFNDIERSSIFNSMFELRNAISVKQPNNVNIIFIAPVRENILEIYKTTNTIYNEYSYEIDSKLSNKETEDLLEKLKSCGLVNFRDHKEKQDIVNTIKRDYESDSFITLVNLISTGKHDLNLLDAYSSLQQIAKDAFIYTSLLHRFKILMPAALLKNLLTKDWDVFITQVLRVDCKGILLNKRVDAPNTAPDLYLMTRHSFIAQLLIEKIVPKKDKQFELYKKLIRQIMPGETNVRLITDLLKSLRITKVFEMEKINKLFDIGFEVLSDEPYYLLYYAINLQYRKTKTYLEKAVNILKTAQSILDRRHHKFIHREAVILFELAKLVKQKEPIIAMEYLEEAKSLFIIKQLLDPSSHYSYVDYLRMQLWILDNIDLSKADELRLKVDIEEVIDIAEKTVFDNKNKILDLRTEYFDKYSSSLNEGEYLKTLDEYYSDEELRPYSLILKFNHYSKKNNEIKCKKIVEELEYFIHLNDVSRFLFKYYGRNLFNYESRTKFQDLIKEHPEFKNLESLRYYYFNYIAESYNMNFSRALGVLQNIQTQFYFSLNPEFSYYWKDSIGEDKLFEAKLIKGDRNQLYVIIAELQYKFLVDKKSKLKDVELNSQVLVKLRFYLFGIRADIEEVISLSKNRK